MDGRERDGRVSGPSALALVRIEVPTGVRNLLRRVRASDDQEVVYEKGGGWWLDFERVSGRWARTAIRMCCLKDLRLNKSDSFERYGADGELAQEAVERGYINVPDKLGELIVMVTGARILIRRSKTSRD